MRPAILALSLSFALLMFASQAKADNTYCPAGKLDIEDTATNNYHSGNPDAAFPEFNTAVQDRLDCDKILNGSDLYSNQIWLALDYVGAAQSARDSSVPSYHSQTEQDFGYARTVIGWLDGESLDNDQAQMLGEIKGLLASDGEMHSD